MSEVLQVFKIGDKSWVLKVLLGSEMVEVEGRGKGLDKLGRVLDEEVLREGALKEG